VHLDPVRSTRGYRTFVFGHLWVVLVAIIRVPFSKRSWAVPLFFRLYRQERDCVRTGDTHRKRTELARELVELAARVAPELTLHLSADAAYCCETVLRGLPSNVIVYGVLRDDAVLTDLPERRPGPGRPRIRGTRLPTPAQRAADGTRWRRVQALPYGRPRVLQVKEIRGQWYQGRGPELLGVVVVRIECGKVKQRAYFSTDPTRSAAEIVERYTARWQIEVCFRDMKQHVGFGQAPARTRAAVERATPFAGYVYTLTVLWAHGALRSAEAAPQIVRPWYREKHGLSIADLIHVARDELLDPAVERGLARKSAPRPPLRGDLAA
jgi:IS4 transposase